MEESSSNYGLIIDQMKMEIEEYKVDSSRFRSILSSVHLPSELSNIGKLLAKSLQTTSDALDVITPCALNLTLALSDLSQELQESEITLDSSQKRIQNYKSKFSDILNTKEFWRRELSRLESLEEQQQQESSNTKKSTSFHSKKIKQYDAELRSNKQLLSSAGYEDNISHETLVSLGNEVSEMEMKLKPLRLQLNSYKDLQPSLAQAQIKLEEKKIEFKQVDKEFSDKLGEIGANAPSL
ncbi:HAUS augmin-like complex subunit 1 [Styela clava]